jgi:hypothetical protein
MVGEPLKAIAQPEEKPLLLAPKDVPKKSEHAVRWKSGQRIAFVFLWGLVPLLSVIGTVFVLDWVLELPRKDQLAFQVCDPYLSIFVSGILVSLWAQSAVTGYFDQRAFFQTARLRWGLERRLRIDIPLLLGFSVLVCLMTINHFWAHLFSNIVYLVGVLLLDLCYLKSHELGPQHKLFKACCRDLFYYIDLLPLFAFMATIVFVLSLSSSSPNLLVTKDAFMSGVIGFHLLVTFFFIVRFLYVWDQQGASSAS